MANGGSLAGTAAGQLPTGALARSRWAGMTAVCIEWPRFRLRDFKEADRPEFVAYQTDPRYAALYDLDPGDTRRADELFDHFLGWQRACPRSHFQLGLFEQRTGKLCGCAGLRGVDRGEAVLGIELAPGEWGRFGLALDATAALLAFGFEGLGLQRVTGSTASGNRRVEKLARRFAAEVVLQREGPAWMRVRGWQEVHWALGRKAWEKTRSANANTRRR